MFDDLDQEKKQENNQIEEPARNPVNQGLAGNQLSPSTAGFSNGSVSTDAPPAASPPAIDPDSTGFNQRIQKLEERGRKRGKRFSKIGIITAFLVGLSMMGAGYYLLTEVIDLKGKTDESFENLINIGRNQAPRSEIVETVNAKPELTSDMKKCENNSDCIETQADCCDCANGGQQVAVNREYKNKWDEERNEKCQENSCVTVVNCRDGEAFCDNGVCAFKEKTAECTNEGLTRNLESGAESLACCAGLKEDYPLHEIGASGECLERVDISMCINCPNNECGAGENICNCPEDCNEKALTEDCLATGTCPVDATSTQPVEPIDESTLDSDLDGLTGAEETVYGTDPANPDSDGDGYSDGSEVNKGYNPLGAGKLAQ